MGQGKLWLLDAKLYLYLHIITQLKKDYVKGLGDTLDLAVFGASWDRDRVRELRGAGNGFARLETDD